MKTCIFTVIKDEFDYIKDFVEYHINLGIDTLFIFEDIDSGSHESILSQYPQVSLHSVKELLTTDLISTIKSTKYFQAEYIRRGLLWIRDNFDYDWCFSIDCDEFITTTYNLSDLFKLYDSYDGLMLQWKNYGCSGHIVKPVYDKPIWEIFTQECGFTYLDRRLCHSTKMCFNMNKLQEKFIVGNHVALCRYVKPDFSWDRTKLVYDKIYLRHYITKSWEEYVWKLTKRGMMCRDHRDFNDFFEMHPELENRKEELLGMVVI